MHSPAARSLPPTFSPLCGMTVSAAAKQRVPWTDATGTGDSAKDRAGLQTRSQKLLSRPEGTVQLNAWLGRQDSNLGMAVPKTAALPLGDAPMCGAF